MVDSRWRRLAFGAAVLVLAGASCLVPAPAYASPALFTWSGEASKAGDPNWSNPENWLDHRAPRAGHRIDVTFPYLTCEFLAPLCTATMNDIDGLNIRTLRIVVASRQQPQHSWYLDGASVTVGTLSVTEAPSGHGSSAEPYLDLPMVLAPGAQAWYMFDQAVRVHGDLTGDSRLTVTLRRTDGGAAGWLNDGQSIAVGDLTLTDSSPESGMFYLGDSTINRDSGHRTIFSTARANLSATRFGPVTTSASELYLYPGGSPTVDTTVTGGLTLDTATTLHMSVRANSSGGAPVPGVDYPTITSSGAARLNAVRLDLAADCTIAPGTVVTPVSAGTVTGLIKNPGRGNLADGATFQAVRGAGCAFGQSQQLKINYTATAVTLTFVGVTQT